MTDRTITVEHNYFDDPEVARREIETLSLYLSEAELPPSGGTPIHWHAVGMTLYITDGKFRFRDPATDTLYECVRGTKFVIPERALHIEEPHQGYSIIVGFTKKDVPQPFVRSPDELAEIEKAEAEESALV